jgi:hypothetical protein
MQIRYIAKMQDKDKSLTKELKKNDHKCELAEIELTAVSTLNGKICIQMAIRNSVIVWYHACLYHPGTIRTKATIRGTMTWPALYRVGN